jgi:hypothetical protein
MNDLPEGMIQLTRTDKAGSVLIHVEQISAVSTMQPDKMSYPLGKPYQLNAGVI